MSAPVLLLVLLAAALHATWNALLRSGANRMRSMTVMCVAIAVTCALAVPFVAVPARASWGCLVASALLHLGYNVFLVRAYRVGDLGQTYPIARGSAPLLVTLGAAAFAGERLGVAPTVGVVLVAGGIMALAFHGRRLSAASLPSALITGGFIGAYSVTDGIGVRLAGDALGYITWMCLLWGLALPVSYALLRDVRSLHGPLSEALKAAGGGVLSLIAYGIVLWAMQRAPLGPVSALRETSVVFAVLIGWLFLGEPFSVRRLLACAVIAAGAGWLGLVGPSG